LIFESFRKYFSSGMKLVKETKRAGKYFPAKTSLPLPTKSGLQMNIRKLFFYPFATVLVTEGVYKH
jgi:hypothetical protein